MSPCQGPLARARGPMGSLWQQSGLEIWRLPLLPPWKEGRALWCRSLGPPAARPWLDPSEEEAGGWEPSSVKWAIGPDVHRDCISSQKWMTCE